MLISYRAIWLVLLIVGLAFLMAQSYFADMRPIDQLIFDSLLPIMVVATMAFLLLSHTQESLLWLAAVYFMFVVVVWATDWIAKPYGTAFFLIASYLLADWFSFHRFGGNIMSDLRQGRSRISLGVFAATFAFGVVTEVVNLPFGIWGYRIPIPSLDLYGIPALIAAFGWTPWTLAILAIFYHFVLWTQNDAQRKPAS